MAEPIQIIDDITPTIFDTFTGVAISNFFCHETVKSFYNIYKETWIPESFFEFSFAEFQKYSFTSTNEIREYFKLYKKDNITSIIVNYMNSAFSLINRKRTRNGEPIYRITNELGLLDISLADEGAYGTFDKNLYSALENIAKHVRGGDELVTTKDLYEKFMLRKYLTSSSFKLAKDGTVSKAFASTEKALGANNQKQQTEPKVNKVLVSEKIDLPKQKGKVVKMFFPRLSLPSTYPTSQEKSRVNTEKTVRRFMNIDDQVALINHYKFNAVKYHQSFIDKRKAAQKTQKKVFDFDF